MIVSKLKNIDKYLGGLVCLCLNAFVLGKRIIRPPLRGAGRVTRKILCIKFWGIGNMVFLMPVLKAIKIKFPDAQICLLTLAVNQNIMQECPFLDGLYLLDTATFGKLLASLVKALGQIRIKGFDVLIDFEIYAKASAILSFLSKAPVKLRIHPGSYFRCWWYSDGIEYRKDTHITKMYSELVGKIGVFIPEIVPVKVTVTKEDTQRVRSWLEDYQISQAEILVGMHVGSGDNFIGRRWPPENFARLAESLISVYGCKIIFTGLEDEKKALRNILKKIKFKDNIIDATGVFTTRQLASLLERLNVFISNDTGPLHIAACMGTPVIGLFGPNTPAIYGPLSKKGAVFYKHLPCSPCITNLNSKTSYCRDYRCMNAITVEEVGAVVSTVVSDTVL